jgi:outer membrane murein-binding lipoprotein Lpp
MKHLILSFLLLFSLCLAANSAELEFPESLSLKNGIVYEGVKLISQTPSEVVFKYSGGVTNVKIAELSEEVQQRLNYSKVDALAFEAAQAEKTALRLKQTAEAIQAKENAKILAEKKKHVFMIRGHVHRVLDGGILIQAGEPTDLVYYGIRVSESEVSKKKYKSYHVARPQREFGLLYLAGHPRFEHLTDADVIDVDVYRDGIFRFNEETRKQFVFLKEHK